MASSARQMRIPITILVSLTLALLLFVTTGVSQAQAAEYAPEPFACSSDVPTRVSDSASGSYDNNGNLYIPCGSTSTNAGTIYRYDPQGNATKIIDVAYDVSDVAPSPDGKHLYLARSSLQPVRLVRNDTTGAYTPDTTWKLARYPMDATVGWYIDPPAGSFIDTDNAGNIYLADGQFSPSGTHTVVKYASDGSFLTRFGNKHTTWDLGYFYHQLNGIAVKGDGSKVYTVEGGNNRVQEWVRQEPLDNSSYKAVSSFGGNATNNPDRGGYCKYDGWQQAFASPYDIALDASEQHLFVLNTSCHQVMKFTTGGSYVSDTRVGVDNADGSNRPHGFAVAKNGNVYIGQSGKKLILPNDDTTPPTTVVAPADGSTTVAVTANATATFNEAMNATTVNGTTFTLKNTSNSASVPSTVSYDSNTFKATLDPNADLESGVQYTATLSGAKDMAGNALPAKTWTFTTASTPPPSGTCGGKAATITGTDNNDTLTGTDAVDVIVGGAGNDTIRGLGGDDTICGGDGYDTFIGGGGDDKLYGEAGGGTANYSASPALVNVDLGTGLATGEGSDTLTGILDVTGSKYADIIKGNSMNNYFVGGAGNDKLYGLSGNDSFYGNDGDDTIDGGLGTDTVNYKEAKAAVVVNLTKNEAFDPAGDGINAAIGTDSLLGLEKVTGSGYADTILGADDANGLTKNGNNNVLWGFGGNDTIYGMSGNDRLIGGGGNDKLYGNAGDDYLDSRDGVSPGNDTVDGGSGTDSCRKDATEAALSGCESYVS